MDENLWQQTQGLRTIGFGWHDIIRKISNKVSKLCTPCTGYYGMVVFLIACFDVSQTLYSFFNGALRRKRKTPLENTV